MKYVLIIIIIWCSLESYSQNSDSITTEIFLDRELLEELSINSVFINSIEYTPNGFILISSPNQFYLLGNGGLVPIFDTWGGKDSIESFTITSDSILVVASGNALYQIDSNASFFKVTNIPDSDMGITSKYKNIYVFDRKLNRDKKEYFIYQISENKEIIPIVAIPTPILSVFEQPSLLIFSTKNILFSVDIKTKHLYQILTLPQEDDIISVIGDTINHAFYFSTNNAIYRIKDNIIELVSEDFGGILKYDGEGLLVFKPEMSLIVRLRNNILYSQEINIQKQKNNNY